MRTKKQSKRIKENKTSQDSKKGNNLPISKIGKRVFNWKGWALIVVIVGFLGTLAGLYDSKLVKDISQLIFGTSDPVVQTADCSTDKMTGEYNIAVANFTVAQSNKNDEADGALIANQLYERLANELKPIQDSAKNPYVIWNPQRIGTIRGLTPEERSNSAAELAFRCNANVVIYGFVEDGAGDGVITPEFYISEQDFAWLPEFVGSNNLGGSLAYFRNNTSQFLDPLEARALVFANMLSGLQSYKRGQYSDALLRFRYVRQNLKDATGNISELGYFLEAAATFRSEDYQNAEQLYSQAIQINPDYARAYIGLGGTYFQRAFGLPITKCFSAINKNDLDLAFTEYEKALNLADQSPRSAQIRFKAYSGLGDIALAHSYMTNDPNEKASFLQDAVTKYTVVISEYNKNPNAASALQESYGIAAGNLGKIAEEQGNLDVAETYYRIALANLSNPRGIAANSASLAMVVYKKNQNVKTKEVDTLIQDAINNAPSDIVSAYRAMQDEFNGATPAPTPVCP